MDKRNVARRITTAFLGSALCAVVSTLAQAQTTIYMTGTGGAIEARFKKFVIPEFEKKNNVKVQYVAAAPVESMVKIEAQRNNPDFDLLLGSDAELLDAEARGLCAPLVDAPVYAELLPHARVGKNAIATSAVSTVIAINEKRFKEKGLKEPKSWRDLGDPQYKNELGFLSIGASSTGMQGLVMVARANGGGEQNIEPGFAFFKDKIKPNLVAVVQAAAKLSEMLQTGEVAIGVVGSSRAMALKESGAPIKVIAPTEGAPVNLITICVVANGRNQQMAQKFVQHSVSVEAQTGFEKGEEPSNKNVAMKSSETPMNLTTVDWVTINKNKSAWVDRWNREIER